MNAVKQSGKIEGIICDQEMEAIFRFSDSRCIERGNKGKEGKKFCLFFVSIQILALGYGR
jgi:hypothetical protein